MTDSSKKTEGRVLLPPTMEPIRYDVKLTPNLDNFTFEGEETVRVKTSADASADDLKVVMMHAKELGFQTASFSVIKEDGSKGPTVEVEEIRTNLKATTVSFVFGESLPANSEVDIHVVFSGLLNNQMAGFYRSKYTDIYGVSKYMASTQFESLDARRAFPCWDEPARKAVFGITLVVDANLTAFSNMPEKTVKTLPPSTTSSSTSAPVPLKKEITYLDSPKMSSYLVAFVVGEFDFLQKQTEHGTVIRVYTPPGKVSHGTFALDCACRSLDLYDNFFGVPYPLPKLDMVAIPEFAAGAMENWGLVTYREVDVLIDPIKASNAQKQRVCIVVAHELAHQWFGNLVTMQWWDDLWLNEGFASWAENHATNALFPDWKIWEQFVTGHLSSALRLDSMRSSHPIQVPIHHAEEVEEVFDAISYCKGGSVVRMIHAVLGMDHFRQGLENYMKKHQYGNTETFDLWQSWESVSGLPIKEMMASWTEQMGFPLLEVTSEEWEENQVTLEVKQSWFLSDGSDVPPEEAKKWTVPIMTTTATGMGSDITFMREETATVKVALDGSEGWVKLNAGQEVPMRVLCSSKMLERLANGIKTRTLSATDRAGLLGDAYALVKAGKMKPEDLMKVLSHYSGETDAVVWESIETVLMGLDTVMSGDEEMHSNFRTFARTLVKGLLNVVSWEPSSTDGHLTSLLRSTMVNLLAKFCYDEDKVKEEAMTRYQKFQEDASDMQALPSDMRSSVFKIVLKNGGTDEYNSVKSYFTTASDNAERKHVLNSIGASPDAALKKQTLEWAISGDIKLQDFFYPIGSVGGSSPEGRDIAWQFFQDNFDHINAMLDKASPSLMGAVIVMCCSGFATQAKAVEIEAYFKEHPLPKNVRKIAQITEGIRTNAKFLDKLKASELVNKSFWDSL